MKYIDKSKNTQEWTLVVKRRKKQREHASSLSNIDSSDSELEFAGTTKVFYKVKDGIPGIIGNSRNLRGLGPPLFLAQAQYHHILDINRE